MMTDKEFTIWGLEQWEKLMENRCLIEQAVEKAADEYRKKMMSEEALPVFSISDYIKNKTKYEQHIPNRFRIAWVHSDPQDPRKWPGLREQLRGIESFLYRDVIRWKYREKLLLYAEEMGLICNDLNPIDGIEAWGAIGGERWMIIPKEDLEDSDREIIAEFLKVEE